MRWRGRLVGVLVGLLGLVGAPLALIVVMGTPAAASTATFTVTSSADDSPGVAANCPGPSCTLRDAVAAGNAADGAGNNVEIDIPASRSPITLTTGTTLGPSGTHPWTIEGTGGTVSIAQTGAVHPVIEAATSGLFTIQNLTITGGHSSVSGAGVLNTGPLMVQSSTISGNTAAGDAGGLLSDSGAVTVVDSTISGNSAGDFGGGIGSGPDIVVNSTISGNTATTGGGIATGAAVTLVYATVVDNTAPTAANLDVGTLASFGSVVTGDSNCVVTTSHSSGFNYSDDTSCGFTASTDNQTVGNNPQLGGLGANGGLTNTMVPNPGSPLIDAIPNAHCGDGNTLAGFTITTDQRGLPRPDSASPACDIGAVEVQPASAPAPVVTTPEFTG